MSTNYVSTKDVHDREIKIRLTDTDADLLMATARKLGIPPAVLARSIVKQAMEAKVSTPQLTA